MSGAHAHGASGPALLALCTLLASLYVTGALRAGHRWSGMRTVAFLAGIGTVVAALLPPLSAVAHHDLRAHMIQHLLVGMLGPVGIVLGAPVGLALRTLPRGVARGLVRLLRSAPLRILAHPLVALLLSIGGMAALYATPLFAAMGRSPALHLAIHVHFLAAGCLYAWSIAGIDPAPHRPSRGMRLAALFLGAAAHAILSKAMYARGWPAGTQASPVEIEQAAQIMYYGGDFAELLLAVVLFARWPWPGVPEAPARRVVLPFVRARAPGSDRRSPSR